jgi:hypothetical protein
MNVLLNLFLIKTGAWPGAWRAPEVNAARL